MLVTINEKISYIKASNNPLSADIGIIKDGDETWLFDVGDDEKKINILDGNYNVVLSHFHRDHIGNINKINAKSLYVSNETRRHVKKGNVVNDDLYIGNIHIFPLPSSHAKGSLGLEVDETYAFVGDGIYSEVDEEYYIYNVQLLKEEIEVLSKLKSPYLLVSHYAGLIRSKDEVIKGLTKIYSLRKKDSHEIKVPVNIYKLF